MRPNPSITSTSSLENIELNNIGEITDKVLKNHITAVKIMKKQFLTSNFVRETGQMVDQEDMILFLEEFVKISYFLQAVAATYKDVQVTTTKLVNEVETHVCKILDKMVVDGHALLELQGGINARKSLESKNQLQRIMRVIQVASNYEIQAFLVHPAIQAILKTHGMSEISDNLHGGLILKIQGVRKFRKY